MLRLGTGAEAAVANVGGAEVELELLGIGLGVEVHFDDHVARFQEGSPEFAEAVVGAGEGPAHGDVGFLGIVCVFCNRNILDVLSGY